MSTLSPFTKRWNPYTHPDVPLYWRKPRMVRVTQDPWFGLSYKHPDKLSDEYRDRIFAIMALCPQHTFYVATERPGRMRKYLTNQDAPAWWSGDSSDLLDSVVGVRGRLFDIVAGHPRFQRWRSEHPSGDACAPGGFMPWPLPNVMLATTVHTQAEADERIPELLECPAAYRAVEVEPREAVDVAKWMHDSDCVFAEEDVCICSEPREYHVEWLILRGGKEPVDLAWLRSLIAQADAAGVSVWVERLGNGVYGDWESSGWPHDKAAGRWLLRSRNGSDPEEWPADLRRRERLEVK